MENEFELKLKVNDEATEVMESFSTASTDALSQLNRDFETSNEKILKMSGSVETLSGKINTVSAISDSFASFSAASTDLGVNFSEATDLFMADLEDMGLRWMDFQSNVTGNSNYSERLDSESLYQEDLLDMAMSHQENLNSIENYGWDYRLATAGSSAGDMANIMGNLYKLTGSSSKKMFAVMKSFAIAEAVIQGYRAAQGAYAVGSVIGGPIVGAAFAASAMASSAARIKQINSTGPGGGGGSLSAGSGGNSNKATSELPLSVNKEDKQKTQTIVVNVHNPLSEGNWDLIGEDIIKSINKAGTRNIELTVTSNE